MHDLFESCTQIEENLEILIEKKQVLESVSWLINRHGNRFNSQYEIHSGGLFNPNEIQIENREDGWGMLNFLTGTIKSEDEIKMRRTIFRISKGRAIIYFTDYDYENENKPSQYSKTIKKSGQLKKIFTIFFQKSEENILKLKIMKILDLFAATRYNVPDPKEISNIVSQVSDEIKTQRIFLQEAEISIENFLFSKCGIDSEYPIQSFSQIGEVSVSSKQNKNLNVSPVTFNKKKLTSSKYEMYRLFFKKEKIIFNTLNKCHLRENFYDGEVWIPIKKLDLVSKTLSQIVQEDENKLTANLFDFPEGHDSKITCPTFIQNNEFMWAFQEIVNTYGIPRYGEINPAYFNVVTFPFLFGIMFGDIGHGFILLMLGLYLCLFSDKIVKDESNFFRHFLKARYLIFFMGFSAFYCGWLYNDFFSIPLEVFPSCYTDVVHSENKVLRSDDKCVYPFGFDHKWFVSTNELSYFNSFKMKMAVIIGVVHMLFGIVLKGMNSLFFKDYLEFYFIFIPQFLFLSAMFGYMDLQIFVKWATNWEEKGRKYAPSIISNMMSIFLKLGKLQGEPLIGGDEKINDRYLQEWVNLGILGLALLLIPIMLLVKPLVLKYKMDAKKNKGKNFLNENLISLKSGGNSNLYNDEMNINNINPSRESFYSGSNNDHLNLIHQENDGGFHHSEEDHEHSFSEIFIHQVIETIEFVLGTVSNTASYLRLWALSLAHSELAKTLFKVIKIGLNIESLYISIPVLFIGYLFFASMTFFILLMLDMMECFLHTLRLHW